MILASINKPQQFLVVNYLGRVRPAELKQSREELKTLLAELQPGYRMLMDVLSAAGVGRVVRVIPDPTKDMGLNILAVFHYRNKPEIITCAGLLEGIEKLLA